MVGLNVFPLEHRYGVVLKCTIIDDYVLATRVLATLQPLGHTLIRPVFNRTLLFSHYHLFSHFGLNNKSLEISSLCWYSSVDTELFVMNFEGDSIIIALKIGPGR